jgi:LemA protein
MMRTLAILVAVITLTGCGYNTIQSMDEAAAASENQIEVQLQRRADLVPNLVEVVKGYAAHEDTIFTKVAEARSRLAGAISGGDVEQMAAANSQMTGALSRLIAIAEAYPDLKANQNFAKLQDELAGTENRIARARTDYTEQVQAYNAYIRRFPVAITAKVIGAKPRKYFQVTSESVKEAPKVKMTGG